MPLLAVGSVAFDTVRTPHGSAEEVLGGSAAYFALAARHFAPVRVVGVVGEDFPPLETSPLAAPGIDTSGLERRPGRTFRWGGRYDVDLTDRETLFTELGVFADFHPRLAPEARRCETVFLGNIQPALQREVLSQMESPRLVAADTMNLWIEQGRGAVLDILRDVEVALLSDEEARLLTGEVQLPRAGRRLLELGVRRAIVKKGENGALYFSPEERFFCPAHPLEEVVDPTGAGDAFAGGLLGYLEHAGGGARPLRAAMVCGAAMASFCVEDFSPRRLLEVSRHEIAERIEAIRRLTEISPVPLWPDGGAGALG